MNASKISVRYAKALFELAKESGELEKVRTDMEVILDVCKTSPEFRDFLNNPVISDAEKSRAFESVFKNSLQKVTNNFFRLLARNKRESALLIICMNFLDFYMKEKHIKRAKLTTSQPVSDSVVNKLRQAIKVELNSDALIETHTDASIIGGFILRIDDLQYDASIVSQLKIIKQELMK